ncbi:hypothetical protein EHS25_003052 [Saitozyma podzolica]|uniref:Uncharacterized protein n=1 Tax=Saitozyma podzolica TaxID=1890683 RepID=A0A427YCZ9_9TREE|nr:hypothetical protein EHS25_003052 [Saitozyma podzolica]
MPSNGVNYISGSLSRVKAAQSTPDKPSKPVRHPRPLFPQPGPTTSSLATAPADAIGATLRTTETGGVREKVKGLGKGRKKRSLEEVFEFSWAKADLGKAVPRFQGAGKRSAEFGGAGENSRRGKRWWDEWTTEGDGGKSTRHPSPGGKERVRPTRDDFRKVLAHPDLAGTAKCRHDPNPT